MYRKRNIYLSNGIPCKNNDALKLIVRLALYFVSMYYASTARRQKKEEKKKKKKKKKGQRRLDTICGSKKFQLKRFINFFDGPQRFWTGLRQFTCKFIFDSSHFSCVWRIFPFAVAIDFDHGAFVHLRIFVLFYWWLSILLNLSRYLLYFLLLIKESFKKTISRFRIHIKVLTTNMPIESLNLNTHEILM